jgi:hypothetical protein
MKLIPQPYQQQQGAGGIVIVNDAIRMAAGASAVQASLPVEVAAKLAAILAKPPGACHDAENNFVALVLNLARIWPQLT